MELMSPSVYIILSPNMDMGVGLDVIWDMFCICSPSITSRLKLFEELVIVEVGFDFGYDHTFYDFGQKGEVGDGSEIAHYERVESRLGPEGGDGPCAAGEGSEDGCRVCADRAGSRVPPELNRRATVGLAPPE